MVKSSSPAKIGFWTMVRDVLIYSMDKGVTHLIIIGALLVILLLKVPPEYIPDLIDRIVKNLANKYFLGYTLWIVSVGGWYLNVRFVLRYKNEEIDRLSAQRNLYQQKCIGKLESSDL